MYDLRIESCLQRIYIISLCSEYPDDLGYIESFCNAVCCYRLNYLLGDHLLDSMVCLVPAYVNHRRFLPLSLLVSHLEIFAPRLQPSEEMSLQREFLLIAVFEQERLLE
jgi:hypothetical protein